MSKKKKKIKSRPKIDVISELSRRQTFDNFIKKRKFSKPTSVTLKL